MPKKFDYTRNARRFVARWPVFTIVLSQVVFWIVAYVFLSNTLNTTARIQSVCNAYNKELLISAYIWENTHVERFYKIESLGAIELKGKSKRVNSY